MQASENSTSGGESESKSETRTKIRPFRSLMVEDNPA
jgi:hypothetical protein